MIVAIAIVVVVALSGLRIAQNTSAESFSDSGATRVFVTRTLLDHSARHRARGHNRYPHAHGLG